MSKKSATLPFVLAVVAVFGLIAWQLLGKHEPVYQGKNLRAWVQLAVLDHDQQADSELKFAFRAADPSGKAEIEKEFVRCAIKALNTRDNLFWKPYTLLRTTAPAFVSKQMPQWREPRKTRRAAVEWLRYRASPGYLGPAAPDLNDLAMPILILCKLAKNDTDQAVRQAAIRALGDIGGFSEEVFPIMVSALGHADPADRRAATRWFGKNTLAPERIVPVLLRGLEDNSMRSDYADALRAYGPRARFVVEPLTALAKTNDRATASVASWALVGIDPEAAAKAGIR